MLLFFFFFNDTATTEIYTLSLHDALPISNGALLVDGPDYDQNASYALAQDPTGKAPGDYFCGDIEIEDTNDGRSEEHTSELQSRRDLVCRLLLEKKKKKI